MSENSSNKNSDYDMPVSVPRQLRQMGTWLICVYRNQQQQPI